MSTGNSVTTWIGFLKSGDTDAAAQLWARYFARMVELARDRLRGLPRRASDEEDIALSAFHSFWQAVGEGRYARLDNRDDLWQLLVMHTARKAVDQRRFQQRQKRGGRTPRLEGKAADLALEQVIGHEPDPQLAALVVEEYRALTEALDEDLRAVAVRKLEGYTNEEIAAQLEVSLRTVERKLSVIRGMWQGDSRN
jgi:DNA-directed RNA polymerase specialized sigma24 family protein